MITHYNSASRGPVEIASMNYNHALNTHIAALEAEQEVEGQVHG
jgi:hypothetical protein